MIPVILAIACVKAAELSAKQEHMRLVREWRPKLRVAVGTLRGARNSYLSAVATARNARWRAYAGALPTLGERLPSLIDNQPALVPVGLRSPADLDVFPAPLPTRHAEPEACPWDLVETFMGDPGPIGVATGVVGWFSAHEAGSQFATVVRRDHQALLDQTLRFRELTSVLTAHVSHLDRLSVRLRSADPPSAQAAYRDVCRALSTCPLTGGEAAGR